MILRCRLILLLLASLFILVACEQTSVAPRETVTLSIAGATAMQPALLALTDTFTRQHPNVVFDLRGGGSELGESLIRNGQIDLGASTLLPRSETVETERAYKVQRTPIGLDGLAILVNIQRDEVETLTTEQVRAIFTGDVLSWSAIGGDGLGEGSVDAASEPSAADGSTGGEAAQGSPSLQSADDEILLVSREDGSGSRFVFEERLMQGATVSLTAVVMPTSADVVAYVASQPNAIGYVSPAYLNLPANSSANAATNGTEAAAERVHLVAIDGLLPSDRSLRDQSYPLTQPLFLLTRSEPTATVRQFVDFVLSPTGQAIVGRYHTRLR